MNYTRPLLKPLSPDSSSALCCVWVPRILYVVGPAGSKVVVGGDCLL